MSCPVHYRLLQEGDRVHDDDFPIIPPHARRQRYETCDKWAANCKYLRRSYATSSGNCVRRRRGCLARFSSASLMWLGYSRDDSLTGTEAAHWDAAVGDWVAEALSINFISVEFDRCVSLATVPPLPLNSLVPAIGEGYVDGVSVVDVGLYESRSSMKLSKRESACCEEFPWGRKVLPSESRSLGTSLMSRSYPLGVWGNSGGASRLSGGCRANVTTVTVVREDSCPKLA